MTILQKVLSRPPKLAKSKCVQIDPAIIDHPCMDLEAIGYYGCLEVGIYQWQELPPEIQRKLMAAGYERVWGEE